MTLSQEVERFRKWAAKHEGRAGEWETEYPSWSRVYDAVKHHLESTDADQLDVESLLYLMARDNECEVVRELIASNPGIARAVGHAARSSQDPEARWQAAVAVAEGKDPDAVPLLREYTHDPDEYVRRRAHLAIRTLDPTFAEQQALDWLDSSYEYSRMVALDTLAATASTHLSTALKRLREDRSVLVRQRIKALKLERPDV